MNYMWLSKFLEKIKSNLKSPYSIIFVILYIFIAIFVLLLFPILVSRDYELLIRVAEFAIIGSGTLTILTFTYAQAKGVDDGKYSNIVHSGELLLKSTVTIVVGLGLIPGVGYILRNHTTIQ